jgi:hypothetical protein
MMRMGNLVKTILISSILILLLSCNGGGNGGKTCAALSKVAQGSHSPLQGAGTTWTILIYLAGDNDLSDASLRDLDEMEAVGSTDSVQVVVQSDTLGGPVQRLWVGQGSSTILDDLGEQNMADPAVLTDFITWGAQQYPADRMALILWSHGDGYQKPGFRPIYPQGILQDDTDGVDCCLSNLSVRQAIEDSGVHFDLLGFDASLMGQIETAYEFKDVADFLVFSQETGQENGWDYTGILEGLTANPAMDVEALTGLIVDAYENFYECEFYPANPDFEQTLTISAIQLGSVINDTATKTGDLAEALSAALVNPDTRDQTVTAIGAARNAAQDMAGTFCNLYADLFDWVEKLQAQTGLDSATMDAIAALLAQREAAVVFEYHGDARPGAKGLSIVFFEDPNPSCSNFDPDYLDGTRPIGFIQDTQWDEFLSDYYTAAGLL